MTETTNTRVWVQRSVVAALWIAAFVLWRRHQTANDLSATGAAQEFIDSVGSAWWGILAFVGVYLARPIVLFPASVLTVVGGVLFGPVVGVAAVIVAANGSAMIAYWVGRLLGRPPGRDDDDSAEQTSGFIGRWSTKLRENSFETILIMRFIFLPYDLVNYAAGALRIRWATFLAATALGSLPGTLSFVLLGASLDRVDQGLDGLDARALVAGAVLFVVSLGVARYTKRRTTSDDTPARPPSDAHNPPANHEIRATP